MKSQLIWESHKIPWFQSGPISHVFSCFLDVATNTTTISYHHNRTNHDRPRWTKIPSQQVQLSACAATCCLEGWSYVPCAYLRGEARQLNPVLKRGNYVGTMFMWRIKAQSVALSQQNSWEMGFEWLWSIPNPHLLIFSSANVAQKNPAQQVAPASGNQTWLAKNWEIPFWMILKR